MKQIYLDNAATTIVDSKVIDTMLPYFKAKFGNASSQHFKGKEAKEALDKSREVIAKEINAKSEEIIFTSGGTEADNLALRAAVVDLGCRRIVTSPAEHSAVIASSEKMSQLDHIVLLKKMLKSVIIV